jgi:hypothetical protein
MPIAVAKRVGYLAGLALASALVPGLAAAEDSMRCGNRLVSEGDPKGKVISLCGEPSAISLESVISGPSFVRYGYDYSFIGPAWREVPVEIWTYNFGSSRLLRRLRFIGDELVDIRTSGYGY